MIAEILFKIAVSTITLGILNKASFDENLITSFLVIAGVVLGIVSIVTAAVSTYNIF